MNAFEIQSAIDRLLDAHIQGKRDAYTTHRNLQALFQSLQGDDEPQVFRNALFGRFLSELRAGKRPHGTPAGIVTFLQLEVSPRQSETLALLLSHLDSKDQKALSVWTAEILPEIDRFVRYGKRSADAVSYLESILGMHSSRRNIALFPQFVPSELSVSVDQIMDTIEEIRLFDFEESLKARAAKTRETHPPQARQDYVPSQFRQALQEASEYLNSAGLFDPKKAADLIRTCIDETHRDLVDKLGNLTGKPFPGPDTDGRRRNYLREAGLFTQPEETFFSSLYTLLSETASHKLITRRDTIVIMNFVVESYIDALYRRYDEFKTKHSATTP